MTDYLNQPLRTESEARAARFDKQRQWLTLKVLPHGLDGWRYVLITGPGMNSASYVCDAGTGFKSFETAKAAGEKAKRQREAGQDYERKSYIEFGRK